MGTENRSVSRLLRGPYDEVLLRTAVESSRESLGAAPTLVVAHLTAEWGEHFEDVVEVIQVYGHAAEVVGCSADGLIGTGVEDEQGAGCSLMFLSLPDTDLRWLTLTPDETDQFRWENEGEPGAWLAFFNPFVAHAECWLTHWNREVGQVPTFGGLASGFGDPERTFVFRNRQRDGLALAAVNLSGGIEVRGVVSQGCRPIGDPYTITEVDQNVVLSIGSRPALEVLESTFDELTPEEKRQAQGNLFAGLAVCEYREEFRRGDFLVRNILGGDPEQGVLALGAFPRAGQTIQFQIRDREAADEDFRLLCARAMKQHGAPFAGFLFSCTGRGERMFGVPNHDAGIVADVMGKVPLSGFFCNGEIGPIGGCNFLHGYTASAAFLYHR